MDVLWNGPCNVRTFQKQLIKSRKFANQFHIVNRKIEHFCRNLGRSPFIFSFFLCLSLNSWGRHIPHILSPSSGILYSRLSIGSAESSSKISNAHTRHTPFHTIGSLFIPTLNFILHERMYSFVFSSWNLFEALIAIFLGQFAL